MLAVSVKGNSATEPDATEMWITRRVVGLPHGSAVFWCP